MFQKNSGFFFQFEAVDRYGFAQAVLSELVIEVQLKSDLMVVYMPVPAES